MKIEYGYCHCGCGQKTKLMQRTQKRKNLIKGQPYKFIKNHDKKRKRGANWKGGRAIINQYGHLYVYIKKYSYPKSNSQGYVLEHIYIVEKILGKLLPKKAVIHHIDENGTNNQNNNLVICENSGYHHGLHRRKRALNACGHSNWLKCPHCKKYDDPKNLYINNSNNSGYHKKCIARYNRQYYQKKVFNLQ